MNKTDLEKLVNIRLKEAEILLESECYAGAYYLMGYAIEYAIKACIAKKTKQYDFPDKGIVNKSHTHDFSDLIGVSALTQELTKQEKKDKSFKINWGLAKDWSISTRYKCFIERTQAEDLYNAITDAKSGILTWLKTYW